ncbi:MAG: phosphosulfolactate synthase [Bacillota bacterium]
MHDVDVTCGDERKAWQGVVRMPYEDRLRKPRRKGMTMIIDKGLGVGALEEFLAMAEEYVDIVKFSFGTSALYPESVLFDKTRRLRERGICVCPGGTFSEVALMQGQFPAYLDYAASAGFDAIEISDGAIELPRSEKHRAIELARTRGFTVISEVGKKHPADSLPIEDLALHMVEDLQVGADYVILEARESGRGVTIFGETGEIRTGDLQIILDIIREPLRDMIIWEAPRPSQQKEFILGLGCNVNLGNVAPGEILAVEALRLGLRGDSLREYFRRNGRIVPR